MNEQLQQFARTQLKKGLSQLNESQQLFFKRIYSHRDLEAPIDDVVDAMLEDKLDWAMQQVERTLKRKCPNCNKTLPNCVCNSHGIPEESVDIPSSLIPICPYCENELPLGDTFRKEKSEDTFNLLRNPKET